MRPSAVTSESRRPSLSAKSIEERGIEGLEDSMAECYLFFVNVEKEFVKPGRRSRKSKKKNGDADYHSRMRKVDNVNAGNTVDVKNTGYKHIE